MISLLRAFLRHARLRSAQAARSAWRFNRVFRYGWDMVLWTHWLGRKHDPIPCDLPPKFLDSKGVQHRPPVLSLSSTSPQAAAWEEGFTAVSATLLMNLQLPDVLSRVRYAHPAPAFRGIYLWDSAFIAQIWRDWDLAVADDVNLAVLEQASAGRLPHVVADFVESPYTQPPLLAWSIERCWAGLDSDPIVGLANWYDRLAAYHHWLQQHRRLPNGLYAWAHPYESGIDNSPRFSSRDESRCADTRSLAAPDFGTYVILDAMALASLADRLGRTQEAQEYRREADELRALMNQHLWDEADGLYYDLDIVSGTRIRSRTIVSLLPLWAQVPDAERAARLRTRILAADEFNTLVPLPTVARNEPTFAKDMWRGPVWVNTAFAVIHGLRNYGYHEDAGELAYRLCDGVYQTFADCRRFFEFYDPDRHDIQELTRKLGNRWKKHTLGGKPVSEFVGWSGLVNSLVVEVLCGVTWRDRQLFLAPQLPTSMTGMGIHLRLPQWNLAVSLERLPNDRIQGVWRLPRRTERFDIAVGQVLQLPTADESSTDPTGT